MHLQTTKVGEGSSLGQACRDSCAMGLAGKSLITK